ncbi:MAG: hypothetical protein EOO28_33070 [Comamonadaceae bacterium]|nr:MAG: hypothetical protein EOO28_33070 [Comamonadaceae bacterium]
MTAKKLPQHTPDQRYLVIDGRLWRAANPQLSAEAHKTLVEDLMTARRAVKSALGNKDTAALAVARKAVDDSKRGLGERGPPWWTDGAPDLNRKLLKNTPYAALWPEPD